MSNYTQFLAEVNEQSDILKAAQLMSWDREVNMPQGGQEERALQLATLSRLLHKRGTSDQFGALLEDVSAELKEADPDSDEVRLVQLVKRQFDRARALPLDYVQRSSMASSKARVAWMEARNENDFAKFQPHLETVIELCQELVEYFGYEDEKYDALLDLYERGMKSAEVRSLFDTVKAATVPLLEAIVERGKPVDDALLRQPFPVDKQMEFARYIAESVGYDFNRGHLGTVVHPFATSFSRNDARITSRWYPEFINPGLFGTLHESGHAMYEQGTSPAFSRTPLARGGSLGLHESQSRAIENIIGRTLGFWNKHFPKLQQTFPTQLGNHTAEQFWRAINKVQPSYIRVEADELTYNFHIILRFELEQAMLNGDLLAADLPTAWNDKMKELLGVVPPTDTLGCLQDVHWTRPGFGYFPTYALGNLYGSQFVEAMKAQNPTIEADIQQGNTTQFVGWMGENIHQHGSKFTPREIVQKATGKLLTPEPFIRYVTDKFSQLYELD